MARGSRLAPNMDHQISRPGKQVVLEAWKKDRIPPAVAITVVWSPWAGWTPLRVHFFRVHCKGDLSGHAQD